MFPKQRKFRLIVGTTENKDLLEQNLPWRFSSRNIFCSFCILIIFLTSLLLREKIKMSISFPSSYYQQLIRRMFMQCSQNDCLAQLLETWCREKLFLRPRGDMKIQGNIFCVIAEVSDDMLLIFSYHSNILSSDIFQFATLYKELSNSTR